MAFSPERLSTAPPLPFKEARLGDPERALSSVILSSFNNQTATAALWRNGSARLALEAGGSSHFGALFGSWSDLTARISSLQPKQPAQPKQAGGVVSIFGGSPFCASTYASKQGPASNAARMPFAPLTLDPSANQEGDA